MLWYKVNKKIGILEIKTTSIHNRDTLEEETIVNDNSIALIACKVDGVRLIDNVYFIGD